MKKINLIILKVCMLLYCSNSIAATPKGAFEVFEIFDKQQIGNQTLDSLKVINMILDENQGSHIVAYSMKDQASIFPLVFNTQKLQVLISANTVDKDQKYHMLVAVELASKIRNSDVKKTIANSGNVEIYFNMEGAKKWSELTAANIGKALVLSVDQRVFSIPMINGKINNGIAIITGLSEEQAIELSAAINESL